MTLRILLIEDNGRAGPLLQEYLADSGYTVDLARSMAEFQEMTATFSYGFYLLDLGLPDGDGFEILRQLCAARQSAPIIITSARGKINDRVSCLDCGADDYLVKPFHRSELLARIRAVLRRPANTAPKCVTVGNLVLECASDEVSCEGRRVKVSPSERRLLALLMRRARHLVSREEIANALSSMDQMATPNSIEKLMSRLRSALARVPVGIAIRTVSGLGYMLEEIDHELGQVGSATAELGADRAPMPPAWLGGGGRIAALDHPGRKPL